MSNSLNKKLIVTMGFFCCSMVDKLVNFPLYINITSSHHAKLSFIKQSHEYMLKVHKKQAKSKFYYMGKWKRVNFAPCQTSPTSLCRLQDGCWRQTRALIRMLTLPKYWVGIEEYVHTRTPWGALTALEFPISENTLKILL